MRTRGFTLVELLVVIGIIAVLIGILLPSLNAARRQARLVKAGSDLRQMLLGYTAYHTDNKGQVLWGFPPKKVSGHDVTAYDRVLRRDYNWLVAQRYPWRLLPYCSTVWAIIHNHAENPAPPTAADDPINASQKAYAMSVNPSFGINSVYVGGTYAVQFPSFDDPDDGNPVVGKHCVFKANEVKNPARLIVFAESQTLTPTGGDPASGLHQLLPPKAKLHGWTVRPGERVVPIPLSAGLQMGLPQGRFGKRTVTGFFDGHVEALLPSELSDMRLWAAKATTPDYNFQ